MVRLCIPLPLSIHSILVKHDPHVPILEGVKLTQQNVLRVPFAPETILDPLRWVGNIETLL